MKEFYPELTQSDFDTYIAPLLDSLSNLPVYCSNYIKNAAYNMCQETYPYHNACMMIAENIWDSTWNKELNKYILDVQSFRNASCENLSQLVFSYLIRSFAEHIKTIPWHNDSPQKIYLNYTRELLDSGFKEFSNIYTVAWGRCINLAKNKVNSIKDAILLTHKHRSELEAEFGISSASKIISLESEGDTHNNGSAVTIITFENGEKIVFKPRSVSGEFAYANLIKELNDFINPGMLALKVVNCGKYGFTSFLLTENEKSDMYQAGRLACLMYLLNATDMHYSNILWTKEGPIPIDLETLFHPQRVRTGIPESKKNAYRFLETSAYGTGVLPLILSSKTNAGSIDVGFTGIRDKNSASPFKIFDIVDGFTSNIKVVWKKQEVDNKLSNDKNYESLVYERCDQIVNGFTDLFEQIYKQKERFTNAVLNSFDNVELRYIHNMTYRYAQILRCLVDAEPSRNRETALALLARIGILGTSSDINIAISECKQLWSGDIPYFSVKFDGTEVYSQDDIISRTALSAKAEFLMKMEKLTEQDLVKQIELVRLAFVAKLADPHADGRLDFNEISALKVQECKTGNFDNQNSVLKEKISWFSKSLKDSMLDDRYAHLPKTWVGPVVRLKNPGWTPGVLGYDLYAGRIGPALSLAAAGRVLSDEKSIEVASEVFERSAKILKEKTYELRNVLSSGIGAFSGISGLLWALCAASNLTGNIRWKEIALSSWALLPPPLLIKEGEFFDMIMGPSASIIMRYHTQTNWSLDSAYIIQCISQARSVINSNDPKITSGLAHGLGQMLWFFSSIAQKQNSQEINKIVVDLDSIIQSEYTDKNGFIQLYRKSVKQVSSSWCNGLAGLLVAYYEAYKAHILPQESVLNIVSQLKQIPLSCIPIYCHGSLGIAEALRYVGESFHEQTEDLLFKLETSFCSPEYIYNHFKDGKSRYTLSPGLMVGKAGALLHLCRTLDPTIKTSPITFGS